VKVTQAPLVGAGGINWGVVAALILACGLLVWALISPKESAAALGRKQPQQKEVQESESETTLRYEPVFHLGGPHSGPVFKGIPEEEQGGGSIAQQFDELQPLASDVIQNLVTGDEAVFDDVLEDRDVEDQVREAMDRLSTLPNKACRFQTVQRVPGRARTFLTVRSPGRRPCVFVLRWRWIEDRWVLVGLHSPGAR